MNGIKFDFEEGLNVLMYNKYTKDWIPLFIKPEHKYEIKLNFSVRSSFLETNYNFGNVSANDNVVKKISKPNVIIIFSADNEKDYRQVVETKERKIILWNLKKFFRFHRCIDDLLNGTPIIFDIPEIADFLENKGINFLNVK